MSVQSVIKFFSFSWLRDCGSDDPPVGSLTRDSRSTSLGGDQDPHLTSGIGSFRDSMDANGERSPLEHQVSTPQSLNSLPQAPDSPMNSPPKRRLAAGPPKRGIIELPRKTEANAAEEAEPRKTEANAADGGG